MNCNCTQNCTHTMTCTCSQDCKVAIKKGCVSCFKFHTETGYGWTTRTVLDCVKENHPSMLSYILEKKREQPEHPHIPSSIWKRTYSDYEIASYAVQHTSPAWHHYIVRAVEQSTNPKNIALFKLALEGGNQGACEIIQPKLKLRRSAQANDKDWVQYMECAVFSRDLGTIMWLERTMLGSTNQIWPPSWRENGDRLLELMMRNKKYYNRLHMFTGTFDYVFNSAGGKAEIYDWDPAAYHVLHYDNPHEDNTWALFRSFWFKGGRENSNSGWKNYCIRYNKEEELRMIHELHPQWHADFLHECETLPGRARWARRNLKEWAMNNGAQAFNIEMEQARIQERQMNAAPVVQNNEVSPLHKMMELLEKMKESKLGGYEEGLYLEACNVMQQLHRQIRV
jgi:hypothetical protein